MIIPQVTKLELLSFGYFLFYLHLYFPFLCRLYWVFTWVRRSYLMLILNIKI